MPRVLFLCTGNTCRSPLAEAFAARLSRDEDLVFESAGLQVVGKHPASRGSLLVAAGHGLDLKSHRSRPVSADQFVDTLWVIGMTRSHAAIFRSRFRGQYDGKVGVLGMPGLDLSGSGMSPPCEEVDDPYQGNEATYEAVGEQIRRLVEQWAPVFSEAIS
jgi:protein arginine phosphatase